MFVAIVSGMITAGRLLTLRHFKAYLPRSSLLKRQFKLPTIVNEYHCGERKGRATGICIDLNTGSSLMFNAAKRTDPLMHTDIVARAAMPVFISRAVPQRYRSLPPGRRFLPFAVDGSYQSRRDVGKGLNSILIKAVYHRSVMSR